jgi:hypothetical protein
MEMKMMRSLLLGTVAVVVGTAAAYATPPEGTWFVDANGFTGNLVIDPVRPNGTVTGSLFGDEIRGFWTESSQKLVFYRAINGSRAATPPEQIQIYTAYQFPADVSHPAGSQRLAGSFEAFAGTGATSERNVFGWYAEH